MNAAQRRAVRARAKAQLLKIAGKRAAKPTFAAKVLAVVSKKSETKYVAEDIQKTVPVDTFIAIPSDLTTPLPVLTQGAGSFRRVGQTISNVRGKTHFNFSLPYNYAASSNWIVRVYMLRSRQVKSYPQVGSLPAATLLDNGDGTTLDWDATATQVVTLAQRPLAHENFIGKYKEFKLSKNSGALNGDASTPPPSSNGGHFATNHQFTWNWAYKGNVAYDENSNYPTNVNPLFILVAYPVDNYTVTKEPSPVIATIRTEMWFKDM